MMYVLHFTLETICLGEVKNKTQVTTILASAGSKTSEVWPSALFFLHI